MQVSPRNVFAERNDAHAGIRHALGGIANAANRTAQSVHDSLRDAGSSGHIVHARGGRLQFCVGLGDGPAVHLLAEQAFLHHRVELADGVGVLLSGRSQFRRDFCRLAKLSRSGLGAGPNLGQLAIGLGNASGHAIGVGTQLKC